MKKAINSLIALLFTTILATNIQSANAAPLPPGDNATIYADSISYEAIPVLPAAKDQKLQWKYTTTQPSSTWTKKDFDDSSWSKGNAGFGNTSSYKSTTWETSDIWLRQEFTLEGHPAAVCDSLVLLAFHDEDCEIYINGILASKCSGYVTKYTTYSIAKAARESIVPGEKNVISIHCYNGGGAGFIDAGLYKYVPCSHITFISAADANPAVWKYTTTAPDSLTWMTPTFDDTTWSEGKAGFGKSRATNVINTQWETNDLWLRKKLNFKGMSKNDLEEMTFKVVRDGTCEIYLDGKLVAALTKNGLKTEVVEIPADIISAIDTDKETTIAVHCYRTNSLRYFDASLIGKSYTTILDTEWKMKEGRMMSKFAKDVDVNNVWGEYPRPQMERKEWQNLNGIWQFQPLFADIEGLPIGNYYMKILVPFPVESAISGIMNNYSRFAYKRTFTVPENWAGKNLIIHFEAVDFECEVFVNGESVGTHKGGYDPFSFDVTDKLKSEGEQELVVKVYDPTDLGGQPRGKQTLSPGGIMYTCASGIWQSVWMEPVEKTHIDKYTVLPDVDKSTLTVKVTTTGSSEAKALITVLDNGNKLSTTEATIGTNTTISIPDAKLWSPDSPFLYDLDITLVNGSDTLDQVKGYFGMRKVSLATINGYRRLCLNNEEIFHMGPLDQGFWPDGIYTAPTDSAMLFDIEATKQMGFNMIRKHIKVEPRRWYYYCDKMGIMVWQDMPSPNSYCSNHPDTDKPQFKAELKAMIESHYNSPCIVMWVLFNEAQARHDVSTLVNYIKSLDKSRLVNQDSGSLDNIGDIWDLHHYPNPAFRAASNTNMAVVCGEYGGLAYQIKNHLWSNDLWGYATMKNARELKETYAKYIGDLIKYRYCMGLSGAVYTQTTDVEIEANGLITYDREIDKLPYADVAAINYNVVKSKFQKDTILAAAVDGGEMWRMTTTKPADNWYTSDFNDDNWKEKKSGFGTSGTPNAIIGTTWSSSDIWIRKKFSLDGYNSAMADSLVMIMTHDEDCEIYINGKLMASYTGHDNNYSTVDFTAEVKKALLYDKENTVAVHCKQTTGGQYIDLGIYMISLSGRTTSIANIAAEKPRVTIDKDEKTVSISGGGFGESTKLEVVSTAGTIIKSVVTGNTTTKLSSLQAGMYILRFVDGKNKYSCKAIF